MSSVERSLPRVASPSGRIPRFDAEFIERRFQEHRQAMAEFAAELASDIVIEVSAAVDRARRELARKQLAAKRHAA